MRTPAAPRPDRSLGSISLRCPQPSGRSEALCLFRVAQEALNNVIRHAGARAASVTLRQMDGGLLLAVQDDGVGFDPGRVRATRRSLGLAEHARTRATGGRHARHRERARPGDDGRRLGAHGRSGAMSSPRRPRVLLADDHLLVAEALKSLLAPEFDLVGVVEDGRALVEAAGTLRPDVIVADITMPHLNGIDALEQVATGRRSRARGVPHHAPGRRPSRGARSTPGPRVSCSSTRRRSSWSRPSAPRSRARPT